MTAEYFDQWFADIAESDARQRLFSEALGLPPEIGPSNTVPFAGLGEIAAALAVPKGGVLVDVACGRGGPGMWIARQAGASLAGIDFSAEAIAQASRRRALFGLDQTATFAVGTLEHTGLADGIADAVLCVDAFQFAASGTDAAAELRRILRPGGRIALTSWEAVDPADESVSERVRKVDFAGSLRAAGFRDVAVRHRADWHESARQLWQQALTLDPAGDPALESTQAEAVRSLDTHDKLHRVMATAVAP